MVCKRDIEAVEKDIQQLLDSNVPEKKIIDQMLLFNQGVSPIKLIAPATIGTGIKIIHSKEESRSLKAFETARTEGRISKFVPASGAATRMFKSLIKVYNSLGTINDKTLDLKDSDHSEVSVFIASIRQFAFFDRLKQKIAEQGHDIETLLTRGDYRKIIGVILNKDGLGYSGLPKGMVKFHRYNNYSKTPFEEHLAEAVEYCRDVNGVARIHFTISADYRAIIETYCKNACNGFRKQGIKFDISFSIQKDTTRTIAVDFKNRAFRTSSDSLLFRPGGHGALLDNLNNLKGDIIFLKNIDNVVPDHRKETTYKYKKILGGMLVKLQAQIFEFLDRLETNQISDEFVTELELFCTGNISIPLPDNFKDYTKGGKKDFFLSQLNRPIRVCGMVENQGEPGGGPFWVEDDKKKHSLQIVESVQVNQEDPYQKKILKNSTHFNPVDIVCGVRDFKKKSFNLTDYADPRACFISAKSKDGHDLKAMELPGLWNGGMVNWITVFLEVPVATFNPVKSINDLLQPMHL
jgi:Domain of unknown function (DUF4301)